jgi:hypothetical protein
MLEKKMERALRLKTANTKKKPQKACSAGKK